MRKNQKMSTQTLVMGAVLTAMVIILQFLAVYLRATGVFAISLVLIPIVIGTATCGKNMGAWLGFVFAVVVLLSGDANLFLPFNAPATIIVVLLKGILCGYVSGLVYELAMKISNNIYVSTFTSAIICPIVNTGIFSIGCILFFMPVIAKFTDNPNTVAYLFTGFIGINFLIELAINIIFSPIIVRILKAVKK